MRKQFKKAATLGCLVLAACGPGFESRTVVSDFRILAIKAEPPDVAPGEETTYEALVANPNNTGEPLVYSFIQCTLGESGCLEYEEALAASGGDEDAAQIAYQKTSVRYGVAISTGQSAVALGANLKTSETLLAVAGESVANAQVTFVICPGLDCAQTGEGQGGGDESILAVKRVRLSAEGPRNANPTVTSFHYGEGASEGAGTVALPGEAIEMVSGGEVPLVLALPESAVEAYTFVTDDGELEQRQERLYVGWYSTAGGFDLETTTVERGVGDVSYQTEVLFQPPVLEDGESSEFTIWAVVWDRRGGIAWLEMPVFIR